MRQHQLAGIARHPAVWGIIAVAGGLLFRSRRKQFSIDVQKTTLETQTRLLAETKQHADNIVRINALPSVPLTMCVPFRNSTGEVSGDVSFPQVGGKGLSLLQMAKVAEINVPMGFVLPVSFFEAWTTAIRESEEFKQFLETLHTPSSPAVKAACQKLKDLCSRQKLTNEMKEAVFAGLKHINAENLLVAVRSSSPEEDLVACSFAGGYETVLGVRSDGLEAAISQVFASCYDERVFVYKMAQGFNEAARDPRIAVVVQLQVSAKAAGVAFSLNPLNNDQDTTLISSCFGLGESVVSGLTSPDEFEVKPESLAIVKKVLGKKQLSVHLLPEGGVIHNTVGSTEEHKDTFSISDAMAQQITFQLQAIVRVYGKPMDTEWAVDQQGDLMWLQARPITAHFNVPKNMATKPGEQKYLYLDMLSTVQGISGGVSILGSDFIGQALGGIARSLTGLKLFSDKGPQNAIMVFSGRTVHVCLSTGLALMGKQGVLRGVNQMDMLAGKTLEETDLSPYFPSRPLNFGPFRVFWGIACHRPSFLFRLLRAWMNPQGAYLRYEKGLSTCWGELQEIGVELEEECKRLQATNGTSDESPLSFVERSMGVFAVHLLGAIVPAMGTGRLLLARLYQLLNKYHPGEEEQKCISALTHGLPGNVTLELGFKCEELARCLEEEKLWGKGHGKGDLSEQAHNLLDAIQQSARATQAWQTLLSLYGHRAAEREIDIATSPYHKNQSLLLANVLRIFELSPELRPTALQASLCAQRQAAAVFLHAWLERVAGVREARRFDGLFRGYERLGGLRETHKYILIKVMDLCRERFLLDGRWHMAAGRLDSAEDVFGLTFGDLEGAWHAYRASPAPSLDLRSLLSARRVAVRKAGDPKLFDSRGLELRAKPPQAAEGVFVGFPVSAGPGPVVGRTKTLRSPDEKPLLEGEILVARATDPGWTPLFVPAAAVVLEVGGPLQHGALVAREYGKPCVVGLEGVVDLFPDGTLVRVNGISGTVELVSESK